MIKSAPPIAVGVLLVAGCSGPGGAAGSDDGVDDAQMLAEAQAQALGETAPIEIAISDAMGATALSPAEWEVHLENLARRAHELTATCMAEQGFEYLPPHPSQRGWVNPILDPNIDFRPWDREWVAVHGFGNDLRLPFFTSQNRPEALDTNAASRARMSPAEEEAWWLALYGDPATMAFLEDGTIDHDSPWGDQGCAIWAWQNAGAEDDRPSLYDLPEFLALRSLVDEHQTAWLNSDQERDYTIDWLECMADHGVALMVSADVDPVPIRRPLDAQGAAGQLYFGFWDEWDWESGEDPLASAAFRELHAQEIAIALADFDCRAATDFDARERAARFAAEEAFIEAHHQDFEALRLAVESGRVP